MSEEDRRDDVRAASGLLPGEQPEWKQPDVLDGVRRRDGARPEVTTDATTIGDVRAAQDTPEDAMVRRERERVIQQALLELDEPSRAVVLLHNYSGMNHDEIAVALGMSHAAVRKRYSRGLKRLARIVRSRLS